MFCLKQRCIGWIFFNLLPSKLEIEFCWYDAVPHKQKALYSVGTEQSKRIVESAKYSCEELTLAKVFTYNSLLWK